MLSLIPPVGEKMSLAGACDTPVTDGIRFYGSGTSALAAVLLALGDRDTHGRREVVIPAYGCPALVSAILYAKFKPVLADVDPSSGSVSGAEWARRITDHTLALVPVNFLGLEPEIPQTEVGPVCRVFRPAVVYDCCQGWPAESRSPDWADATVVSFGRGKPISLGGGGGVLVKHERFLALPSPTLIRPPRLLRFRAYLYNRALHPRLYWWIDKLPFLGLGRTEYQPLSDLSGMPYALVRHVRANVSAYLDCGGWTAGRVESAIGLNAIGGYYILPALRDAAQSTRLLRLPVVAPSQDMRDAAIAALRRQGYGATPMYRRPLWEIAGLEFLGEYADTCPNATLIADRLLTLPIHSRVSEDDLIAMAQCLANL